MKKISVRHFVVPIFGRNLELTGDDFYEVSESHNDWCKLWNWFFVFSVSRCTFVVNQRISELALAFANEKYVLSDSR